MSSMRVESVCTSFVIMVVACIIISCNSIEMTIAPKKPRIPFIYKDSLLFVAYSTLNHPYPINTMSHFKSAIEYGFNSIKTDLRLSKDNKLVLCHDDGYTFDENRRITNYDANNCRLIHDLGSETILSFEFSRYVKQLGYYEHPLLLEDYLDLCAKSKVIPFITIRNEYVDETLCILFRLLEEYGLNNNSIINVYPPSVSTCLKIRSYGCTPICFTFHQDMELNDEIFSLVNEIDNLCFCIYISKLSSVTTYNLKQMQDKGIGLYTWFVSNEEQFNEAILYGCTGFQVTDTRVLNYK